MSFPKITDPVIPHSVPPDPRFTPSSRQVGGSHYLDMPIEPWDIIGTWSIEQQIGFFRGNALKYLLRAGSKGDVITDLDKCVHYIERLKQTILELKESPR